jgi:hypothetical protein
MSVGSWHCGQRRSSGRRSPAIDNPSGLTNSGEGLPAGAATQKRRARHDTLFVRQMEPGAKWLCCDRAPQGATHVSGEARHIRGSRPDPNVLPSPKCQMLAAKAIHVHDVWPEVQYYRCGACAHQWAVTVDSARSRTSSSPDR